VGLSQEGGRAQTKSARDMHNHLLSHQLNNLILPQGSLLTTTHVSQSLQGSVVGEGKPQEQEEDDYQLASVIQKTGMIH